MSSGRKVKTEFIDMASIFWMLRAKAARKIKFDDYFFGAEENAGERFDILKRAGGNGREGFKLTVNKRLKHDIEFLKMVEMETAEQIEWLET